MTYCPRCGTKLVTKLDGGRERPACPNPGCGFLYFGEHSIGAGAVVVRDGAVLLVQRGIEPNRGAWQIPGGYVESDEQIGAAVEREVLEEAGIAAKVTDVVAFRHSPGERVGRASNIYVVFRLAPEQGEPHPDGHEALDAGFFTPDEIKAMERVTPMSLWAIEQALTLPPSSGMEQYAQPAPFLRPGATIFGLGVQRGAAKF